MNATERKAKIESAQLFAKKHGQVILNDTAQVATLFATLSINQGGTPPLVKGDIFEAFAMEIVKLPVDAEQLKNARSRGNTTAIIEEDGKAWRLTPALYATVHKTEDDKIISSHERVIFLAGLLRVDNREGFGAKGLVTTPEFEKCATPAEYAEAFIKTGKVRVASTWQTDQKVNPDGTVATFRNKYMELVKA